MEIAAVTCFGLGTIQNEPAVAISPALPFVLRLLIWNDTMDAASPQSRKM